MGLAAIVSTVPHRDGVSHMVDSHLCIFAEVRKNGFCQVTILPSRLKET